MTLDDPLLPHLHKRVDLALRYGLPAHTVGLAVEGYREIEQSRAVELPDMNLGNGTAVTLIAVPTWTRLLPRTQWSGVYGVFVGGIGWTGYQFEGRRDDLLSDWYVGSKITPRGGGLANACDGAGLALIIGILLDRPALIGHPCSHHYDRGSPGEDGPERAEQG